MCHAGPRGGTANPQTFGATTMEVDPRIAQHAKRSGSFTLETAGGDAGLLAGLLECSPPPAHQ